MDEAACAELPFDVVDELFFPDGQKIRTAREEAWERACKTCPVRLECFDDAMVTETPSPASVTKKLIQGGVWAGTVAAERVHLRRNQKMLLIWRRMIEAGSAPWHNPDLRVARKLGRPPKKEVA